MNITSTRLGDDAQADNYRTQQMPGAEPAIETRRSHQEILAQALAYIGIWMALSGGTWVYRVYACWGSDYFPSLECTLAGWLHPAVLAGLPSAAGALWAWSYVAERKAQIERARIVRDETGIPLSTALLHTKPLGYYWQEKQLAAHRLIEVARAQPFGAGVDALSYHNEQHSRGDPPLLPDQPDTEPPALPDPVRAAPGECLLAAYRRAGLVDRSGNSLHLGRDMLTGAPVYLDLGEWGSLAIGGLSRTGKSSRAVYVACQAALSGWRLLICDPDGPDEGGRGGKRDSLSRKLQPLITAGLVAAVAAEPAAIVARIADMGRLLEQRRRGAGGTNPIVLIVDEVTNLVLGGHLPDASLDELATLAIRGAGYGLHCVLIGHDWAAAASGSQKRGGLLRRLMTQRLAHRLNLDGARFLAPSNRDAQQLIAGLRDYHGVYLDGTTYVEIDTPYMQPEDVAYAAANAGTWRGRTAGTSSGASGSLRTRQVAPVSDDAWLEMALSASGSLRTSTEADGADVAIGAAAPVPVPGQQEASEPVPEAGAADDPLGLDGGAHTAAEPASWHAAVRTWLQEGKSANDICRRLPISRRRALGIIRDVRTEREK